jgi:NAD(P)-dependent dehydrogenase (short-subunit alcohol dehydrogenase family)
MSAAPSGNGGLNGRVAIVTGGSRGIGYAIAEDLVAHGAKVVITSRNERDLEASAERLGGAAVAVGVCGSAQDEDHQASTVLRAVEWFGSADMLVLNAAVSLPFGPLVEADLEAVRQVMNVNVVACLGWTQAAWRGWMRDHGGAIVNVASVFGLRAGAVPTGAYNVSKAALIHLTRQLGAELGPRVRVNAIAPAMIKTDFVREDFEGRESELASVYPLHRLGEPSDPAHLARFLLSDDAAWISGETVVIDGGLVARGAFSGPHQQAGLP